MGILYRPEMCFLAIQQDNKIHLEKKICSHKNGQLQNHNPFISMVVPFKHIVKTKIHLHRRINRIKMARA